MMIRCLEDVREELEEKRGFTMSNKFKAVKAVLKELNAPTMFEDESIPSSFHFIMVDNEIYDENEVYSINYVDEKNSMIEMFIRDEMQSDENILLDYSDYIMDKIENALPVGYMIEWIDSIRFGIYG